MTNSPTKLTLPSGRITADIAPQQVFSTWESMQLFSRGLALLQDFESSRRYEILLQADQQFEQLTGKYPQDVIGLYYLGMVRGLQGFRRMKEVVEIFEKVKQVAPVDLQLSAQYNLGLARLQLYSRESLTQAESDLNQVVNGVSQFLGRRRDRKKVLRYRILQARAQTDLAQVFAEKIRLSDSLESADRLADKALSELGKARAYFKELPSETPQSIRSELAVLQDNAEGTLYLNWGLRGGPKQSERFKLAEKKLKASLQMDPYFVDAMGNLQTLYVAQERWDEAEFECKRALAIRPDDEYSFYNLGNIERGRGNWSQAIANYSKAPSIIEATVKAARIYADKGMIHEATQLWHDWIERNPGDTRAYYHLGLIQLQVGDRAKAREYFLKAEDNPQARKQLEELGQ